MPAVSRETVLFHRTAAQQLRRVDADPSALAVLDLGVQDTPYGVARQALAARTTRPLDDPALMLVWSTRGAPHLHRIADLPAVTAQVWPLSDADATARINNTVIREGAKLGRRAFTETAEAFRAVVTRPMSKGEVSGEVSARIDPSLTYDCASCAARHISGALFQQAGLAGGVRLEVQGNATVIAPLEEPAPVPERAAGTADLIRTYLRLLGPATPAEAAKYLGTTRTHLKAAWPDDLAEVAVAGSRAWLPTDSLDALLSAERPELVRFLPAADPFLQARDRDFVVPDKAKQAAVWRPLGNPGALLVDGDIAGTWRAKLSGKRLTLTVTPFAPLPARARKALTAEAETVAAARGATTVTVEDA